MAIKVYSYLYLNIGVNGKNWERALFIEFVFLSRGWDPFFGLFCF